MNIARTTGMIEAEMKIRDYREQPTDEVYCKSVGSIGTLLSIGLMNAKEHDGYMTRLNNIKRAAEAKTPTPTPSVGE